MKLKQQPDDFQVEELTDVAPAGQGAFALYRLDKRGWTTIDALQAVRRRWHIEPRRLSYGGLKDRHAHTVQYFTLYRGPRRGFTHHGVTVDYLGQVPAPYTSRDIRANRFQLTLRAMDEADVPIAERTMDAVRAEGVPNYFDEQRFGSVTGGGTFVARLMVLGRYEEALRLALAEPYAYDRAPQKREKAILRAHWGDWVACKNLLPRCHARSLADYLVSHPTNFRGAVARLRPELQGLYLSAYQSHLWNRMLARWLQALWRPEQLIPIHLGTESVPFYQGLDEVQRQELVTCVLPLPSARVKLEPSDPLAGIIESVVAEEGFTLRVMKLKGLREPYFSKGDRPVLCLPASVAHQTAADELHLGQRKLVLAFELPRGSYATLIVKRLQAAVRPDAVSGGDRLEPSEEG
jgi:tRNA pseudouridine13 synthase